MIQTKNIELKALGKQLIENPKSEVPSQTEIQQKKLEFKNQFN